MNITRWFELLAISTNATKRSNVLKDNLKEVLHRSQQAIQRTRQRIDDAVRIKEQLKKSSNDQK